MAHRVNYSFIDYCFVVAIAIMLCLFIISLVGCKPDLPVKAEYGDNLPCYLADKCITINAYMQNNKADCTIALQKCYKYSDYEKCKKDADPKACWDELGIRY